jgi:hypothetical protein
VGRVSMHRRSPVNRMNRRPGDENVTGVRLLPFGHADCGGPIVGDCLLRRNEWHSALADKFMQPRFDAVFRVWGCAGFDPQVAGIVRVPAKFKWHEVVSGGQI